MNTKHTGHSDGASEIAQEHRGTTNHPKQTTEAVRTMDTSSTIRDTMGRCELARAAFPLSAGAVKTSSTSSTPTARDVARHALAGSTR